MAYKNVIRVSEFEKLYYDDLKPFQQKHWEALCRYLEHVNKQENNRAEYFRILNKSIQFLNYVGVIQAGNLTIEILPKTDRGGTTAVNETVEQQEKYDSGAAGSKQNWHDILLQMLKECRLLRVYHVDYANLNLKSNSILEIYLELFLQEAEKLMHEGLLKKYRKQEANQTALKGQLQFAKQVMQNIVHQERFFVRYTEYNRDNIFNQILYKTLLLIPQISNSAFLLDKARRLLLDFPEVSGCKVTAETFERLSFDRKTERYKEALLISKMLLLNYRPDITGGSENVMAILFDMNKLWEEFVYRRLKREENNFGITVQRQQSEAFWKSDLLMRPKTIRPDIVIHRANPKQTIVLDTKWKVLEELVPSDEDLKQMFVYNLFWDCERSILLYPANELKKGEGYYHPFPNCSKSVNQCAVITISVMNNNKKLDEAFGTNVLNAVLQLLSYER
jgi:5-methylcytosine-specific restriction enzyme subunit McrC